MKLCSMKHDLTGNNLDEMLNCYCQYFRPNMAKYLNVFAQLSLGEAIEYSTGAICPCGDDPHKHPHQRRLPAAVLDAFLQELRKLKPQLQKADSFEKIFELVSSVKVHGIGPVTLYDAALRISAKLKKTPDKWVYLYAHANIPGRRKPGKEDIGKFDALFAQKQFTAYEIEEFLCVFYNLLESKNISLLK